MFGQRNRGRGRGVWHSYAVHKKQKRKREQDKREPGVGPQTKNEYRANEKPTTINPDAFNSVAS